MDAPPKKKKKGHFMKAIDKAGRLDRYFG